MAYGTIAADYVQSSTANTAPVFRDGNSAEIGRLTKASVSYDGSAVSTRASFNISSVSKTGTGNYSFTFTTSFPDTGYSAGGSVNMYTGGYISAVVTTTVPTISTSSITLSAINYISGGSYYDASYFLASFNR